MGQALASVANLCDLDLITVAGSVALGYGAPFFQAANEALHDNASSNLCPEHPGCTGRVWAPGRR